MKKLKKAQVGSLVKGLFKGAAKTAVKKTPKVLTLAEKVEAKKFALTPFDKKVGRETDAISKRLNINKYNETPPPAFKLTAEQKANNDRILKNANNNMKSGGMIKRADGSMSKRGLWDNIRANKGSGKKPTAAMLKQEKKIKAQTKKK
jgi:hypothetical protein